MEEFTFFWSGPFSQWHPCVFVVNGVEYNCAEQFMMHSKAIFFSDYDIAEMILREQLPREQKALGRQVKNFRAGDWNRNAKGFVYLGNFAKFYQNAKLMKKLKNTRGTTLVEASPHDKIWGIGLREDDERAKDRKTWLGTNWLGETLTQVREDLFNEK